MTRRSRFGWGVVLAVVLGVLACSKGEKGAESPDRVLARVGKEKITEADMREAIDAMPKHEQAQYQTVMGRKRLLDMLVDRLLLVAAAEDKGMDQTPDVTSRMEEMRRSLLTAAYRDYMVEQLPKPTEEDLKAYYDGHHEEFTVLPRVNASWIKCATKAKAEAARQRVVGKGEHFGTVAREVSIDECSKKDNGLLGYFNPAGYVRCIGNRPEFSQRVFELEAEDVSEVFPWDNGWAIVKVHEKTTERQEPFSKARDRIAARLRPQLSDSLLQAELQLLRQRIGVEMLVDAAAELADKSAEDLMKMATEGSSPIDKIEIYKVLLQKYPHHERADEAQFMIGFVLSEELHDYDTARKEYQKVLDNYPDSDVRDSVLYMMQNMGRNEAPEFQEAQPAPQTGR